MLHPEIADALGLVERTRYELEDAGAHDSEPDVALHLMIHHALAGSPFPSVDWAVFTTEASERLDEVGEHLYRVIQREASLQDFGPLLAFAARGNHDLAFASVRLEGRVSNVCLGGLLASRAPIATALEGRGLTASAVTGLVCNSSMEAADREWLSVAPALKALHLFNCEDVADIRGLPQAPTAELLSVWDEGFGLRSNPGPLGSLHGIGAFPKLKTLVLHRPREVGGFEELRACPRLERVVLVDDDLPSADRPGLTQVPFEVVPVALRL